MSNAGWEAFNEVHANMDQIRLHSASVDKHLENAMKFLEAGSDREVKLFLPKRLKNISRIADECLRYVRIGMGTLQKRFWFHMAMLFTGLLFFRFSSKK